MDDWPDRIEIVIDKCPNCGHHWYREQPDPEDLALMYDAAGPLHPNNTNSDKSPSLAMIKEIEKLARLSNGGRRLLDYGSGFGRWARAAFKARGARTL